MSLPTSIIKAALQDWLSDTTSLALIWQFQNTPEPNTPFISINPVISVQRIGLFDEAEHLSTGLVNTHAHRRVMASLNACGVGALDALCQAQDKLDLPSLYDGWFYDRGLSAQTSDIRNLTGMKNGRYEQRAQMDIYLTCVNDAAAPLSDDVGWFNKIEYSSTDLHIPTTIITGD